jgi:hypothetical protein
MPINYEVLKQILRALKCVYIVTCWLYTSLIRRVLVRMIGFIRSWVTHSILVTFTHRQYSAIAHLHTLQLTVANTLWFTVSTSRLLATDFNTRIIRVSLNHTVHILHIQSSLHKCALHNSRRELSENYCSLLPRTTPKRASVSPISPWSDMQKNRALLLLRQCGNAWRHCGTRGGHVTHPHSCCCAIQVFTPVA